MIDFNLDSDDDLDLMGKTTDTIGNRIKRRLRTFVGEWDFDENVGFLRRSFFDGLDFEFIKSLLITEIKKDNEVKSVEILEINFDNLNRVLNFVFKVNKEIVEV